jgi:predicted MPP superfamily phosphohydrolase
MIGQAYDIIGDIHGYSDALIALLEKLGYQNNDGIYQHSERQVIFLGDFIDRGPGQRETINLVRPMIESGTALAVMGNHEFNALCYATPDSNGGYLRPHSAKNQKQHQVFLDAYADCPDEKDDTLSWFKTLPVWLDLGGLRVVHACWDEAAMSRISETTGNGSFITDQLLTDSSNKERWEYQAVETLLKGKEIPLANGQVFHDKDGNARHEIRIAWWDDTATTYRDVFMGPESARKHIPDDPVVGDHLIDYQHDMPPVFLGHYWLEGKPQILATNIACVDYSVAKPGGKLVAYRWEGEQQLSADNFIWVNAPDDSR